MSSASGYVELDGLRMWYEEQGSGDPLVLLHPGGVGVDSRVFGPNLDALTSKFRVFLPERRGHGRTPDTEGPYTFGLVADDTIRFLEQVVGGPARLFGMSDGGVVALHVAIRRPDLVQRLICAASVFHRDGWLEAVSKPIANPPDFLVARYGEISPDGPGHLSVVNRKLHQMHIDGPALSIDSLSRVSCRTLVMVGDDDEVSLEHATAFYRALPDGELAVVPGTSHGLLAEKPELCNKIALDFLRLDPVPTFAPIRRAANSM